MKKIVGIIILILSSKCFANSSCLFSDPIVQDIRQVAVDIQECFSDSDSSCFIKDKSLAEQEILNMQRLVPSDRTLDNGFKDRATGVVSLEFGNYPGKDSGKKFSASTEKISRCHIITSAHLLYADGDFPVNSENYKLTFKSGQSCDINRPFKNDDIGAKVHFRMTDKQKRDFICKAGSGKPCQERMFKGHFDLIILKLDKVSEDDSFFTLNTQNPNTHKFARRVDCFGYPGENENLPLPAHKARMFMWEQKGAQIFGDNNGEFEKGVLTNAVSYKGMSGGGCVFPEKPRELVGLFAKDNKSDGKPVVDIARDNNFSQNRNFKTANYLAAFHELSKRYYAETGKKLEDLDKECGSK